MIDTSPIQTGSEPQAPYPTYLVKAHEVEYPSHDVSAPSKKPIHPWSWILQEPLILRLEHECFPHFLRQQRWFSGKARQIRRVQIQDWGEISKYHFFALIDVQYEDLEGPDHYALPLGVMVDPRFVAKFKALPQVVLCRILLEQANGQEPQEILLVDPLYDEGFCRIFIEAIDAEKKIMTEQGSIMAKHTPLFPATRQKAPPWQELPVAPPRLEQSNSSIRFGDRWILKLYRRLEPGINPEFEINHFLMEHTAFRHIPKLFGDIQYHRHDETLKTGYTLALLQGWVDNQGTAWDLFEGGIREGFQSIAQNGNQDDTPLTPKACLTLPAFARLFPMAFRLGERTAALHRALTSYTEDPEFVPIQASESVLTHYQQGMLHEIQSVYHLLEEHQHPSSEPGFHRLLNSLLEAKPHFVESLEAVPKLGQSFYRIRCHGDYHLGQILWTTPLGNGLEPDVDFILLDFEGEPIKSLPERCAKHLPLKDIAGLLRSFSYAAYGGLSAHQGSKNKNFIDLLDNDPHHLLSIASNVYQTLCQNFLEGYFKESQGHPALPSASPVFDQLLHCFILEKAFYEIRYELNNRPQWVAIPMMSLLSSCHTHNQALT